MELSCIIVDDEPLALHLLESYVNKTPFLQLKGTYSSAVKALQGIKEESVNLLFLDIQMPELNGLEFSKVVPKETKIIFTTAFSQYALDSYKVDALDYLLKPISYADFLASINKAVQWFDMKKKSEFSSSITVNATTPVDDFIYVKSEYKLIQVALKSILYIEGLKDYVKIHIEGNPKSLLSMVTLKSLEEKLPTSQFIRVHRSYIVQKEKIRIIEHGRIVFGKEYIPISESYRDELNNYLESKTL